MKNNIKLASFYNNHLIHRLRPLEEERKQIAGRCKLMVFVGLVLGFYVGYQFSIRSSEMPVFIALVFFPIVMAAIPLTIYQNFFPKPKQYKKNFKEKILTETVRLINPKFKYFPKKCIPEFLFNESEIFKGRGYNTYNGDDYVKGTIGTTKIEFSELHVGLVRPSQKSAELVFNGIFFAVDFNKSLKYKTHIFPSAPGCLPGSLGKNQQKKITQYGELVKPDNLAFEKKFHVYSENKIEARHILSEGFMEKVHDFAIKTDREERLSISFVDSKMFIAVFMGQDMFEPGIFRTILDMDMIRDFFEILNFSMEMVEDLNLKEID